MCEEQIAKHLLLFIGHQILICVQSIFIVRYTYTYQVPGTPNIARACSNT